MTAWRYMAALFVDDAAQGDALVCAALADPNQAGTFSVEVPDVGWAACGVVTSTLLAVLTATPAPMTYFAWEVDTGELVATNYPAPTLGEPWSWSHSVEAMTTP